MHEPIIKKKDNKAWNIYAAGGEVAFQRLLERDTKSPSIWVSTPEPNKVDVYVWVYDKAGNKSDSVKLLDYTKNSTNK